MVQLVHLHRRCTACTDCTDWCKCNPVSRGLALALRSPLIPSPQVLRDHASVGCPFDGAFGRALADLVLGGQFVHQLAVLDFPSLADAIGHSVIGDSGSYRGHGVAGEPEVQVVPRRRRHLPRSLRRWMNRRAAIEPVIGHLKAEHRMERNRLKGKRGDQLNAVLSACGFNLRKLLRAFLCPDWPAILASLQRLIPVRPSLQMR